jgi:hypothetical protein
MVVAEFAWVESLLMRLGWAAYGTVRDVPQRVNGGPPERCGKVANLAALAFTGRLWAPIGAVYQFATRGKLAW